MVTTGYINSIKASAYKYSIQIVTKICKRCKGGFKGGFHALNFCPCFNLDSNFGVWTPKIIKGYWQGYKKRKTMGSTLSELLRKAVILTKTKKQIKEKARALLAAALFNLIRLTKEITKAPFIPRFT